jgi:hypothetical protein
MLVSDCNLGYATRCTWAPLDRPWDAVRLAVAAPEAGQAAAEVLRLIYVCERDHRPASHGVLEFDLAQSRWLRRHDDARIQKMADCYLESYLKKLG